MAERLTDLLLKELRQLEARIKEISIRKQAVQNLLNAYQSGQIPGAPMKVPPAAVSMFGTDNSLSTLDMAQQVIEKHGEMKADRIMELIREEFGVRPAHTLPQMLYIRSRAKKRFYRTPEGKFGIIHSSSKRKRAA